MPPSRIAATLLGLTLLTTGAARAQPSDEAPPPTDYVTAAHGAWLTSVSFENADEGPTRTRAFETYDGHTTPRIMLTGAARDARLELVYELPARTTFERLAVPDVGEVPSSYVTFFRDVEVWGSPTGVGGEFELLARATLSTHSRRGEVTELEVVATAPVSAVKLVLAGGINDIDDEMSYEFSELIGNGTQETVAFEDGFTGIWDARLPDIDRSAGSIELRQKGVSVTGCYRNAELHGTVSGNILRAEGTGRSDGTPSRYVLLLDSSGALRGTANSNNGPFSLFGGPVAPQGTTTSCSLPAETALGCGSTVYVQFEFDSAELRPESEPVLGELFEGLGSAPSTGIVIVGHTSSEGSTQYNQGLSERRAQSVVDDLVRRGIAAAAVSAEGRGEDEPIASNRDEIGRSLNRRVEVRCQE